MSDAATEAVTEIMPPAPSAPPAARELFMAARFPRVNLLPPQVLAARRLHRAQQGLAAGLAGVLLSVAGAWYVEHGHVAAAQRSVAAQQARTSSLTQQQARYAEVPLVLAQVDRASLAQAQAMAGDVLWYRLVDAISRQAPAGVWITDLSISMSPASTSSAGGDPLAKPAIATIAISGYGLVPDDVAAWLDALTHVDGLSDARYSVSSATEIGTRTVTQFTSSVGVTSAALSHRFDQKVS